MKSSVCHLFPGKMGINLGGHQLVLSGGAQAVKNNFNHRQHELRPPLNPSFNVAPPFQNVNTSISNPASRFPVPPTVPIQNTIPLPPNLPTPPSIPLPPNLPPPPAMPLPPVPPVPPMPQVPPPPSFNSVPLPLPVSQSFQGAMLPPPTFSQGSANMSCKPSMYVSDFRFIGQSQTSTDFPIPKKANIKRSNSLDSLIDGYNPNPNKRLRKSPSRYNQFESSISKNHSRQSFEPTRSRSFDEKDPQVC
jgi:hypothetical protein